jgi:hypothetical protein
MSQANFGPYCFHIPQTFLWAICKTWRHRPDTGWVTVPWFRLHWGKQEEVWIPSCFFLVVLAMHHWNHLLSRAHAVGFLPVEHHHDDSYPLQSCCSYLVKPASTGHLIWFDHCPFLAEKGVRGHWSRDWQRSWPRSGMRRARLRRSSSGRTRRMMLLIKSEPSCSQLVEFAAMGGDPSVNFSLYFCACRRVSETKSIVK